MLPTILLGSLGELVKTLQRRGVSKEGNRLLRWALVIASTQAVRRVWNEDSDYLAVLRQTILRGGVSSRIDMVRRATGSPDRSGDWAAPFTPEAARSS
jgi:transposase